MLLLTVRKKLINSFELTGHADAGEYGNDIVCAAVSVLAISTVNGLQQLAKADLLVKQDEKKWRLFSGYFERLA